LRGGIQSESLHIQLSFSISKTFVYRLFKVIRKINKTLKWPLMSGDTSISHWVAQSGKLLMLGDAAHAMVPYMSQGAAMAVEDGAALATSLSHVTDFTELPKALSIFEAERMKRSGQMQEASLINGKIWHFEDGPEQEARDEAMRPEVEGRHFMQSPNQWSDPVTQAWAYGYDAEEEIEKRWKQSR
jgi:salicylate hydroxylase